jgi:signal transduction histidine kinase
MNRLTARLIAIASWLVASTLFGADAPPTDHITLQLKWKNQFQFAGYYAAIAQGYYKDAGLAVTLREAEPGQDAVQAVLKGHAEFGVGTSDVLLLRQRGAPIVVLAAIFQHSPLVLLTKEGGNVKDIQDVQGKPIMIEPDSAELSAYFKYEGVDLTKLKIVPHTYDITDLLSGKVAAMSAYSTDEPYRLNLAGVKPVVFTPRAGGIDFYGDNLFTTEAQVHDHPDRVRAFREASLKGWQYAMDHPEEIVDLILRDYNTQNKTRDQLLFEAKQTADLMHPELIEVGHMNPGRWRHMADTYAEFGMLPADYDITSLLYDPNPKLNYAHFYWPLAIVSLIAMAALVWILPLYRLNLHLRQVIAREGVLIGELLQAKETAEAANAAKSRYLAVITHEVRTPLSGIIGLAGLLRDDSLSTDQLKMLEVMQTTGQDMLRLINDVLEYSKIEEGRLPLELTTVDVAPFLDGLRQLFQATAKEKSLDFQVSLAADAPRVILTDVLRLKGILRNMLSNAIKFTERGAVTLEVSARAEPAITPNAGACWRWIFTVRDTGVGIAPEHIEALFKPYAQAHPGIAPRYGGTGLGLAISQQLARLLGGDLKLKESAPGQGSTFVLEIVTSESLGGNV